MASRDYRIATVDPSVRDLLITGEEQLKSYIALACSHEPNKRTEMERLVIRVTAIALEGSK